ncbi:MAG: hypothetical protein EPO32_14520 [Anaerolineae bacterium]|nr:MAG: hypothetical protein EPO32_14520 [Anaerolineae bacterium]
MKSLQKSTRGLLLYILGLLIMAYLAIGSVWADLEAIQFDAAIIPKATFDGLRCPILLTKAADDVFAVYLENGKDTVDDRPIRVTYTEGSVIFIHEHTERIPVEVGETKRVEYPITWLDAAWGRFILVKVYIFADYPFPASYTNCGIWMIPISFLNGYQLLVTLLASSAALLLGGGYTWVRAKQPLNHEDTQFSRAMLAQLFMLGVSLAFALLGNWLVGGLSLLVSLLLSLTILNRFWR